MGGSKFRVIPGSRVCHWIRLDGIKWDCWVLVEVYPLSSAIVIFNPAALKLNPFLISRIVNIFLAIVICIL